MPRDIADPPLSVIESWPPPNYIDPPDRGPALFVLSIFLPVLGALVICFRTYSRVRITKSFGLDDVLIWVSFGFALSMSILVAYANRVYFNGRHIWDIPVWTAVPHRKNVWLGQVFYICSSTAIKISILLFYRRLTVRCSQTYMVAIRIGLIYNVLMATTFFLILLLTCLPTQSYWWKQDALWAQTHQFHCISEVATLPLSGIFSVAGDIYSTALPFFVVQRMQLQPRQQMVLYAVFAVGSLVVISGIVRVFVLFKLQFGSWDYTWHGLWDTWVWSTIEIWLAILCASAPALRPFFGKLLGSRTGSKAQPGAPGYGYGYGYEPRNKRVAHVSQDFNGLSMNAPSTGRDSFEARQGTRTETTDYSQRSESKTILVRTDVTVVETEKQSEEFSADIESFYGPERRNSYTIGLTRDDVPLRHIAQCARRH